MISFALGFICGIVVIVAVEILIGTHAEIVYLVDRRFKDYGLKEKIENER